MLLSLFDGYYSLHTFSCFHLSWSFFMAQKTNQWLKTLKPISISIKEKIVNKSVLAQLRRCTETPSAKKIFNPKEKELQITADASCSPLLHIRLTRWSSFSFPCFLFSVIITDASCSPLPHIRLIIFPSSSFSSLPDHSGCIMFHSPSYSSHALIIFLPPCFLFSTIPLCILPSVPRPLLCTGRRSLVPCLFLSNLLNAPPLIPPSRFRCSIVPSMLRYYKLIFPDILIFSFGLLFLSLHVSRLVQYTWNSHRLLTLSIFFSFYYCVYLFLRTFF